MISCVPRKISNVSYVHISRHLGPKVHVKYLYKQKNLSCESELSAL